MEKSDIILMISGTIFLVVAGVLVCCLRANQDIQCRNHNLLSMFSVIFN